ncbi:MAG: DNA polymerase III subunit delta' [Firmicutes bacterium]|nr:DNA polymerase III subunit delta' [Bacillota bacterium]
MGLERLVGQEMIIKVLRHYLVNDRLPHALLFSGPQGTGKSTMALLIAQFLNCTAPAPPCGECISCKGIAAGRHPDVVVVEAEGQSIKIDQIRAARKQFVYIAHGPGRRVCIIEDAHDLTPEAASSLLKILEEPPERLVFILTTFNPSRLPPTVVSRCQHFMMRRLNDREMADLLSQKSPASSEEDIDLAVKMGEGIAGRALEILVDGEWGARRQEAYDLGARMVAPGQSAVDQYLLDRAQSWVERKDLPYLLELLATFFRDGLFWSLCRDPMMLTDITRQAFWEKHNTSDSVLMDCLKILNRTRRMLFSNVNLTLAIENVFLQIRRRVENV